MFYEIFDKLRIKIPILASLITTIYCFFNDVNFLKTCYIIISTIIVFYILGSFAEFSLKTYVEKFNLLTLKEKLKKEEEERIEKEEAEKKKMLEESLENDIENLYAAIDSEILNTENNENKQQDGLSEQGLENIDNFDNIDDINNIDNFDNQQNDEDDLVPDLQNSLDTENEEMQNNLNIDELNAFDEEELL